MDAPLRGQRSFKQQVRDAYGEFIARYPWEWFVTLTFVERIHPEAALKSVKFWISVLNREVYGRRWFKKPPFGVYWIAAVEYQKRGVIHFHILMTGVKSARRLTYMDKWLGMGEKNGFARVEPVDSRVAVSRYLSKYVAKDGEMFFSENLPDLRGGFWPLWSEPVAIESDPMWIDPWGRT